jgi:hypothetical protein
MKLWDSFCRNVLDYEGSTRAAALIRIGLVFLIWCRWAGEWLPFRAMVFPYLHMQLLSFSFYLFTFLMLAGKWTRFSTFCTGVILLIFYYYVGFARNVYEYTHHHTYLLALGTFFLSFTDCGKSFSLDRYEAVKKALKKGLQLPAERGTLWGMRLIALQLTAIYLFSAYNKTNVVFLSGMRMEHIILHWYFGSDYPPFPGFQLLMMFFAVGTIGIEYFLVFGLWFEKLQKPLILCGILFHLILYWLLPVSTFTLTICLLYLAYIPPQKVHDWFDKMIGRPITSV